MPIGASINQVTQIGAEAVAGTLVPAVRRLQSLGITVGDEMDIGKTRPRGSKFASQHPVNREWSSGSVDGNGAYNELQYPLSGVISRAAPANLVSTFAVSTAYALGQIVRPTAANGSIYKVTVAGTSGATEPVWPTAAGGTVVSGTVTFQQAGSDALQAWKWVFAASTFSKDNVQTYSVESVDTQRNRAMRAAYMLFQEFSIESSRSDQVSCSGSVVGRNLQKNVVPTSAGLVIARPIPMTTGQVNVYMDNSAAALGTTKLDANFGYSISYGDRFNQAWVHDRSLASWKEHVESEPTLQLQLTIAEDAIGDTVMQDARVGVRKFVRFELLGPEIQAGSGIFYSFVWDLCCQVSDAPSYDDQDDAYVTQFTLEAEHDDAWGKATQATLVNANGAL